MRLFSTTKVSLRALRRNKLRSLLTALGLIIGVGAVIATVSIGYGAKSQVEALVSSLGQNVITVFPGNFTSGGMRSGWGGASSLTTDDAEAIAREIPGAIGVSPEMRDRQQVLANGLNWNTQILGESPDYPSIRSWPLATGAVFSEQDVRSMAKVAVIGKTVADQLFPNEDPLGKSIRIRNIPFKIVGVLEAKGFNLFGQDQDDIVVIPYTSHLRRIARRPNIGSILVQARSAAELDSVQQQVTDLLTQRRRAASPTSPCATRSVRPDGHLHLEDDDGPPAHHLLVSLIVGGIGIMNIMLVSVTERTREIGTRLAVGAHGRDVLLQFLIEAMVVSVLGGAIGIAAGSSPRASSPPSSAGPSSSRRSGSRSPSASAPSSASSSALPRPQGRPARPIEALRFE
jgi:putative ABC transport system permease protein